MDATDPESGPSALASAAVRRSAGGGLSVRALRPLARGDFVTLDFGDRSNAELLVARGEALSHNPLDTCRFHMEPSSVPDDEHRPVREALLGRLGMELGREMHLHPGGQLDPITLEAMAILAASPTQLRSLARTEPLSPLPPAVELRALANLAQVCSVRLGRYPASLEEDEEAVLRVERRVRKEVASGTGATEGQRRPPKEPGLGVEERAGGGDSGGGSGERWEEERAPAVDASGGWSGSGAWRVAGLAATGRALRLRVAEQRILEENLEAIQKRIDALRREEREGRRGAAQGKGATKGGNKGGREGGDKGSGQNGARRRGSERRSHQGEGTLAEARGSAGGADSAGTPSVGGIPEPSASSLDLLHLARTVPPMLWSQTDSEINLSIRLPSLELLSPLSADGRALRLHVRGFDRGTAAPTRPLGGARSAGEETSATAALPAGRGAPSREFNASLQLWGEAEPLRPTDVVYRGSLLQVRLRKAEGAAGGGAGQGGVAWPRLLQDAAAETFLRRRGLLRVDLDAATAALEREEADTAESERVRLNLAWLEDKWARQGRAHTTLADMMGNAEPLPAEAMEEVSALGGLGAMAARGWVGKAAGGSAPLSGLGDLRSMPGLSAEQLQRLEAGEHPSRIPGLEGGVDLEIDEAWVRQARRESRGRPGGKAEL
jgi:hypothetical protein